jgi:hypothetical protein
LYHETRLGVLGKVAKEGWRGRGPNQEGERRGGGRARLFSKKCALSIEQNRALYIFGSNIKKTLFLRLNVT